MTGYKFNQKSLGKRSVLNALAAFDEAGAETRSEKFVRQCSTLPVGMWGETPLRDPTMIYLKQFNK